MSEVKTKTVFLDDRGGSHDTEDAAKTANLEEKLSAHMDKLLLDRPKDEDWGIG